MRGDCVDRARSREAARTRTRHVIAAQAGTCVASAGCLEGREPVGSDRLCSR